MLLRPRKSRIYFLRRFFDYPITLSLDTIKKLGLLRMMKIGFSYLRAALFPFRPEKNLEEFFINRFGRELYRTFFKSYTEKVWGERCSAISAEWGAQRVKGLSILGTLKHIFGKLFRRRGDIAQKGTETSLIEQFLYPKHGPGQMWETVARGNRCAAAARSSITSGSARSTLTASASWRSKPSIRAAARPPSIAATGSSRPCPSRTCPRAGCRGPGRGAAGQRGAGLPRLHHRRPVAEGAEGPRGFPAGRAAHPRQLDLHPGARRAGGPLADLQQLEPLHGRRSVEGLGRAGVLLLRERRFVEDVGPGTDRPGRPRKWSGSASSSARRCWTPR